MKDRPTQIIALAIRYANAFEPPLRISTVSKRVFQSGTRLDQLLDGGDLNSRTADDVVARFDAIWPAGAAWPAKVERPSLTAKAALACDADDAPHVQAPNGADSNPSSSAAAPVAAVASASS